MYQNFYQSIFLSRYKTILVMHCIIPKFYSTQKSHWKTSSSKSRTKLIWYLMQGILTEGEGSVQLTSLHLLVQIIGFCYCNHYLLFSQKQATLMRRSIVLSPLLQWVFPALWSLAMQMLKKASLHRYLFLYSARWKSKDISKEFFTC